MLDLPHDLPRLRTIETYPTVALAHVQAAIATAEELEVELRARRPRREPAAWVLSYLREGGRPVPDSVHAGDCRMTSRNTRPLTAPEARRLLAGGHVEACAVCRADSELGILE
ncbi:DUF6233 domain-containing protein [Streptomyces sp. NPDC058084]|uniref:DUF6233 domain-containing protein n=1 Tax=Streptomyces sp. NPDC058084 TaxID=3346333 RepID=UPI0036EEBAD6